MNEIRKVGVVGAGQMGRGIAQVAAAAGLDVVLVDGSGSLADQGKALIDAALAKQVEKGKMKAEEQRALVARIATGEGVKPLAECDLLVEAATENVEIKLAIFREADALLAKHAILASNTSSISITR